MKAGTDFEREAVYTYVNAVNLENGEIRNAGDAFNLFPLVSVRLNFGIDPFGLPV